MSSNINTHDVHPSAVGSNVRPTQPAPSRGTSTRAVDGHEGATTPHNSGSDDTLASEGGYPEQKHAGAVGYGPNYRDTATLSEKVSGLKEEIVGKMTKNRAKVEHGKELRTGELRRHEREEDLSAPFGQGAGQHEDKPSAANMQEKHDLERAKSIRPE